MKISFSKQRAYAWFMRGLILQFFLVFSMVSFAGVFYTEGQGILQKKISLRVDNMKIKTVLKIIEQHVAARFGYQPQFVDSSRIVTLTVEDTPVLSVLNMLFDSSVKFDEVGGMIIFKPTIVSDTYDIIVSGKVVDETGAPMPGVNVLEKGTTNGTITDAEGKYSISVLGSNAVLLFTFIGYVSQEALVNSQAVVNVQLAPDQKQLDEVVVVGYGTQKKTDLTDAVDVVAGKTLEKLPTSNITQSLQGLAPSLIVTDGGGKPGTALAVMIRGAGTLGNVEPLVVIDGVPCGLGDFNILNPNNIESISVLKDASSAAIYGSRGSNGVLLVTTKKGRKDSPPVISLTYSQSVQAPTKVPQMLDSWDYAVLRNEALTNSNKPAQFTDSPIQAMKDGSDTDRWANTNWWNQAVQKSNDMKIVNINVGGGSKNTSYNLALGYTKQNGLVTNTDYSKYNARLSITTQISDNIEVRGNATFFSDNNLTPYNYSRFFSEVMNTSPYIPVKKKDGSWGHLDNESTNPIAWVNDGGWSKTNNTNVTTFGSVAWEIIKGLKWKGQGSYNYWVPTTTSLNKTIDFINSNGSVISENYPNQTGREFSDRKLRILQTQLDYEKSIGKHFAHALVGFSDEKYMSSWVGGWRRYIPDNNLSEINAATGSGDQQGTHGSSEEWKMRSYFGRLNYDFDGKYYAETNFRYDGSSRLAPGHHYVFYPSGSVGWTISKENFMSFSRNYIDNLKFRTSYGQMGNQTIGLYQYADLVAINPSEFMFNHQLAAGSYNSIQPNYNLGWETSTMLDVGVDVTALKNRLTASFDRYEKQTKDILMDLPVGSVIGIGVASQNAGKMKNWGWELSVNWEDKIRNVSYGVRLSLSDQKNEVINMGGTGPWKGSRTITQEGQPLNELYAYVADGFYASDQEIKDRPAFAGYKNYLKIGDIKYKDISGPDGKPDRVIDSYDRTYSGWSSPRYLFGLDLTAEYRGFDFRAFFQGVGKRDEYTYGQIVFLSGGFKHIQDERWNPNKSVEQNLKDAKYPRLTDGQGNNYQISSFWLHNAAYCRLKNLQIGYTLPKSVTSKVFMPRVRLYGSANNLFTITKFPYLDPEGSSGGDYYPQLKTYTFGLDVTIGK